MCEPAHSIIQFPDPDRHDDDNDLSGQAGSGRFMLGLGRAISWGKKIGKWFHFSKFGSGHTAAIDQSAFSSLILDSHVRYETVWWNRSFKLDDYKHVDPDQYRAAYAYSESTVLGSIKLLRQFLRVSWEKTSHKPSYVDAFTRMLKRNQVDRFISELASVVGVRRAKTINGAMRRAIYNNSDASLKLMLGWTRKKNVLVPVWYDK